MNAERKSKELGELRVSQGKRYWLVVLGGILAFHSLGLGGLPKALIQQGGVQVISDVLSDDVAVERTCHKYEHVDQKKRRGLITTITRKMWDNQNAQMDIKTYQITYSSTYYQNTGSKISKENSSQSFEPVYFVPDSGDLDAEKLTAGLLKNVPLEVRDYKCELTENDSDCRKTMFGYRVQWKYRDGVSVKTWWKDNRRFKVILENWTPMPGKNCGEQYNGSGAWYTSPSISRHNGNGEIICVPEQNLGGVINLAPNSTSQLLFKEHVWP
jgi:hypothetical protein